MHVRNLIFWHLNISECASKRNTRNNEKRSRCQIRLFFSLFISSSIFFWYIFFVPFLLLIRKNQKIRFLLVGTAVRCATYNFKVVCYLFVVATLYNLIESTVFKLLGLCFRWLTQSFKLLVDSFVLFEESTESFEQNKCYSISSLSHSTCFPFLDHHMCDDGLIVK